MLARMKLAVLSMALVALAGCGGGAKGGSGKGGTPPPQSAEPAIRSSVDGYLKALASGDAAAVCRSFSVKSRAAVATFGRDKLKAANTCTAAMQTIFKTQPKSRLKALGTARITRVDISGITAAARVQGLTTPIGVLREGGDWKIRSQPTGKTN